MSLVLCTGVDANLVAARSAMLRDAGHDVISAMNQPELLAACRSHKFDVAVIGQAMVAEEKLRVHSLIRQHCPGSLVLEIFYKHKVVAAADSWLEVERPLEIPAGLVQAVNALSSAPQRKPISIERRPRRTGR